MKYLKLFLSFFRASLIADAEYRLNFSVRIFTDVIWYFTHILLFRVLYSHSPTLNGWTLEETQVFLGVLFTVDALWMFLFMENLERFSEKVRRGDLDLALVKPVNSQFMMSFQRMSPAYLGNLLMALSWLTYALTQLPQFDKLLLLGLPLLMFCGLCITYSMRFMFSATAVIFTRAESLNYIWYQFYKLGSRPDAIYPPWIRYLILSFIPVGFIASAPASFVVKHDTIYFFFAPILAVLMLVASNSFWRYTLRHYTSASS